MSNEGYNGWTNWETWNSYNWLSNDPRTYFRFSNYDYEDEFQAAVEDWARDGVSGLALDAVNAFLHEIDWEELFKGVTSDD